MLPLHLPNNVKVHFAGAESQTQFCSAREMGVSYFLFTCYPWVERKVFKDAKSPIVSLKWQRPNTGITIPHYIAQSSLHTIQDSGLFTLMFGSQKDSKKDERLIWKWYDGLVEFTLEHGQPVTCVEVDCQKLLGANKAWEFRERMRQDLPKNRIINVFHLEDGHKGLDRLIEFSEYIAISVPELRFAGKKNFVPNLARYIKTRKPEIDIHLLGCTEISLIQQCRFCTSADSTSYTSSRRFGMVNNRHISHINSLRVKELVGADRWQRVRDNMSEKCTNGDIVSLLMLQKQYEEAAGSQDYFKAYNPNPARPMLSTGGAGIV